MSLVLECRDVTVAYRSAGTVVRDVSLEVPSGALLGLQGPSGSGKSTLLKAMGGLLRPVRGSVMVAHDDGPPLPVWLFARHRPGAVGWISQDPLGSLDPLWSIRRIVGEPAHAQGMRGPELDMLIAAALYDVGLAHVDPATRPGRLSVGQCQRVAIARVIVGRPQVVLADEPTSALDPTTVVGVAGLLERLAQGGAAMVVASHDDALLRAIATRVVRVRDGRLDTIASHLSA